MPIVVSERKLVDVAERLPCRGCTADCPNYATCEGKPWRSEAQSAPAASRTPVASASHSGEPRS